MFFRIRTLMVFFWLLTGSTASYGGVTQTTSFTLSVTIPERAQTPQPALITNPASSATTSQPRINMQSEIRDHAVVFIISYLAD